MNKAIFALLATTTEAALNHKFSSARNAIHNARENNWSRPSLDNAWSAIDSAWDTIDNKAYPSIDDKWAAIDNKWASYDRKSSSIDDKWAAIDNKWSSYDRMGSSSNWADAMNSKSYAMDRIHNARQNNWSRPSLDNAWSAIDSAWDKIDNYGSNRGSSIDDRWAAYDRKGSSIDDKWAAIDNKWAAYDKKGSSIDDKWAAIDNKWSVMDHIHNARQNNWSRPSLDNAWNAIDNRWAQIDAGQWPRRSGLIGRHGDTYYNGDLSVNGATRNFLATPGDNQQWDTVSATGGAVLNFKLMNLRDLQVDQPQQEMVVLLI